MATAHQNTISIRLEDVPSAKGLSFGIVVSEWNTEITENLYKGAHELLVAKGALPEQIKFVSVPGSFELIYGCKKMQEQMVNAVIAVGSVIQGETKHFDFVCEGVTHGIKDLNFLYDVPVIFCVLTDNNMQQGLERSGGIHGNKGTEAAHTALWMLALKNQ